MDTSFMDFDLESVPDAKVVPDGEYQLEISRVELRRLSVEKGEHRYIRPTFNILEEPESKSIGHFVGVPNETDDDKQRIGKQRGLKSLVKAFGLVWPIPQDVEAQNDETLQDWLQQWVGATGYARLRTKNDPEYGEQNYVAPNGFVTGA